MSEWTDEEIEKMAAKHYCSFEGTPTWTTLNNRGKRRRIERMRDALAAVPRVPEGHWLAPDEPTKRMIKVSIRAVIPDENGNLPKCSRREKHRRRYHAMRDVVKGRK